MNETICPKGRQCVNHPGTFDCPCEIGLIESKSAVCEDIDECYLERHNCHSSQFCENKVPGEFWP